MPSTIQLLIFYLTFFCLSKAMRVSEKRKIVILLLKRKCHIKASKKLVVRKRIIIYQTSLIFFNRYTTSTASFYTLTFTIVIYFYIYIYKFLYFPSTIKHYMVFERDFTNRFAAGRSYNQPITIMKTDKTAVYQSAKIAEKNTAYQTSIHLFFFFFFIQN